MFKENFTYFLLYHYYFHYYANLYLISLFNFSLLISSLSSSLLHTINAIACFVTFLVEN